MTRRSWSTLVGLGALLLAGARVAAQVGFAIQPTLVRSAVCQQGLDSLKGTKTFGSGQLMSQYDSLHDTTTVTVAPEPGFEFTPREGINQVIGIMRPAHQPP